MHQLSFAILSLFMLAACNKTDTPQINIHEPSSVPVITNNIKDGTYCFNKLFNQDITTVKLMIAGNDVSGRMDWVPYEKDSARGTLQGFKNAAGEFDLRYDYMIEGSHQTETKIMKVEDGKLWIKMGELMDPKNDGNLVYKDVSQAQFSEALEPVQCK
jgi:hypothetical protein